MTAVTKWSSSFAYFKAHKNSVIHTVWASKQEQNKCFHAGDRFLSSNLFVCKWRMSACWRQICLYSLISLLRDEWIWVNNRPRSTLLLLLHAAVCFFSLHVVLVLRYVFIMKLCCAAWQGEVWRRQAACLISHIYLKTRLSLSLIAQSFLMNRFWCCCHFFSFVFVFLTKVLSFWL